MVAAGRPLTVSDGDGNAADDLAVGDGQSDLQVSGDSGVQSHARLRQAHWLGQLLDHDNIALDYRIALSFGDHPAGITA